MADKDHVRAAAEAHTNLTVLSACVAILEGGCIYGGNERTNRTVAKIIKLCQSEQQRLLTEFDAARAMARQK